MNILSRLIARLQGRNSICPVDGTQFKPNPEKGKVYCSVRCQVLAKKRRKYARLSRAQRKNIKSQVAAMLASVEQAAANGYEYRGFQWPDSDENRWVTEFKDGPIPNHKFVEVKQTAA